MEDDEPPPPDEPQDEGQKNPTNAPPERKSGGERKQHDMNKRRMPINGETIYKGYCNVRIHELSQPRRWLLLYTYKNFRQFFEAERAQSIKEKVQELFGMTPEEAEFYFNKIRQKKPHKSDLRFLKQRIRRERKAARREAYCIFHAVLKRAMKYSHRHPPPLLVTPMLRMVSDHMLAVLAELQGVDIPKRSNYDNMSTFLISIADWCALFVSNIYYDLEVETRKEEKQRLEDAAIPCSESSSTTEGVTDKTDKTKDEEPIELTDYNAGVEVEDEILLQQQEEQ